MAQLQSLADAPNTLREYETIYILKPDTINDRVGEVNERVKGIIEGRGGKVLNVDNWGKRKLAYEIRKELKGIYLYWQYLGNPDIVAEFERNMRMLDAVIRYMTVKLDKDVDPGARPTEIDDETYEKASTTAADEEEIMLGRGPAAIAGDEASEGTDDESSASGEGAEGEGSAAAASASAESSSDETTKGENEASAEDSSNEEDKE